MSEASPDRDVIDAIDELVDAQMRQEPSGYDHNINQQKCPHSWCREDFHPLPIKQRMQEIRLLWRSTITYLEDDERVSDEAADELDAYRYDQDDSPILCPGSTFTGEFTPPAPESDPIRGAHRISAQVADQIAALLSIPSVWDIPDNMFDASPWLMPEMQFPRPWDYRAPIRYWRPLQTSESLRSGPLWWRCDDVRRHGIRLDTDHYREVSYTVPGRATFPNGTFVTAGHEQILLRPDYAGGASAVSGFDRETGDEWMEIHCATPPDIGDWYLRDGGAILNLDEVRQLEQVTICFTVAEQVYAGRPDHLNEEIAQAFTREARTHFPAAWIDSRDLVYRLGERDRLRDTRVIEIRWCQPRSERVELRGGPANGRTQEAGRLRTFDRINILNPVRIASFRDMEPTAEISTTSYQLAGFNTVTRNVVFRPVGEIAPTDAGCDIAAARSFASFPVAVDPNMPPNMIGFRTGPQPVTLRVAPVDADPMDPSNWQEIGTIEGNSVQFTPTDDDESMARAVDYVRNMRTAARDSERDAILAEYARIPGYSPADQQRIIIASRQSDARQYARQHHIRHPIIVDLERSHPEDVLRGLNLNECRIHEIAGGLVPQHIIETLRMLAAITGRPLESFYATPVQEQAA